MGRWVLLMLSHSFRFSQSFLMAPVGIYKLSLWDISLDQFFSNWQQIWKQIPAGELCTIPSDSKPNAQLKILEREHLPPAPSYVLSDISCCHQEALHYSVCCLNLSTAVQNKSSKPSTESFPLHWVIKHFVEGSDSHQCWQTRARQRKAWKAEGAMVKRAPLGGTGWLPI